MNVFDPGQAGIWVVDPSRGVQRANKIAAHGLGFTYVLMPRQANSAQFQAIRDTVKPDGTHLKVSLWEQPLRHPDGSYETPETFAQKCSDDIARLASGSVAWDIEVPDTACRLDNGTTCTLADYFHRAVIHFRQSVSIKNVDGTLHYGRPTFLVRLDCAPRKGYALPKDLLTSDPNLYADEQTYWGNMEGRFAENEAWADLTSSCPAPKASLVYGAAGEACVKNTDGTFSWERVADLPNYYQGKPVRSLERGSIWQDDLMADFNLL